MTLEQIERVAALAAGEAEAIARGQGADECGACIAGMRAATHARFDAFLDGWPRHRILIQAERERALRRLDETEARHDAGRTFFDFA